MGNGCAKRSDATDDADDEVDDDDDDDIVDEFAMLLLLLLLLMLFGFNAAATTAAAAAAVDGSKFIWSISNLIGTPPADSFSQILAGDQIIAFELDRVDLVDKFSGSSSSISVWKNDYKIHNALFVRNEYCRSVIANYVQLIDRLTNMA